MAGMRVCHDGRVSEWVKTMISKAARSCGVPALSMCSREYFAPLWPQAKQQAQCRSQRWDRPHLGSPGNLVVALEGGNSVGSRRHYGAG
jgi:hypothetical protein